MYLLKHERLQQLYDAGFNIADFICFPPGELDMVQLKKFFEKYQSKHGISIRNFHQNEMRHYECPVKYEVKDWQVALSFCQEQNRHFFTLCNESIKLDDSICKANLWILSEQIDFLVEYSDGAGSPRMLYKDNKPVKFLRRTFGDPRPWPSDAPEGLMELGCSFRKFPFEEYPMVVEFNIYPYTVGKRQKKVIVWEYRKGLLHDSLSYIQYQQGLIERLKFEKDFLTDIIVKACRLSEAQVERLLETIPEEQ